jgi:hypothetical protein
MVIGSTLTSGLIHRIMAPGGIMNGDNEDASAAMGIEAGTAGSDMGAIINVTYLTGISSDFRHMVHSSTR